MYDRIFQDLCYNKLNFCVISAINFLKIDINSGKQKNVQYNNLILNNLAQCQKKEMKYERNTKKILSKIFIQKYALLFEQFMVYL